MIRYRADHKLHRVVAVECPHGGYPHPDADGETQYDNSHFTVPDAAWECLRTNAEAGVALASRAVKDARSALAAAETRLVEEALDFDAMREAERQWKHAKERESR